ncbi:MAG: DUF4114 domain-containing protein [Desulfuromonadales bacterium]
MRKQMVALLAGAMLLMATSAMATVVNSSGGGNGSEQNMQQILNSITSGGTSNVNAFTDFIKDPSDALWTTGGVGISSATMIVEIAGWAGTNNFGIYDSSNISNKAELFNGAASTGSKVSLTFGSYAGGNNLAVVNMNTFAYSLYNFGSETFGFYFNNTKDTFLSDTSKNADQYDHMVAYQGTGQNVKIPPAATFTPWLANEYVLGFEDTFGGGDHDYNDMVLMVESVAPVPEPGTMMLLGLGMLGMAVYGKRRMNKEA